MPSPGSSERGIDVFEDIAAALANLEKAELELDEATQRTKDAKQALGEAIGQVIKTRPVGHDRKYLVRTLYWELPNVNTSVLTDAFSMHIHELIEAAGSWVSDFTCPACGTAIIVSSRSELKEVQSRWRKYQKAKSGRNGWAMTMVLCDACREDHHRRTHEEYEAIHQARLERMNELHIMPYRDYLQTPEWHETRKSALKRARFRCELCNADGLLNVHHRTYERRGYEDRRDLIVLCSTCHDHFHDRLQVGS